MTPDSGENKSLADKFRDLPKPAQVGLIFGGFLLLYSILSDRNDSAQVVVNTDEAANVATSRSVQSAADAEDEVFSGLKTDRKALIQSWFEQNRREISDMRQGIEKRFGERDDALNQALEQNAQLQREMRQMLADFTAEIRSMEASSQRDREVISQLAEETRELQLNAPAGSAGAAAVAPVAKRKTRISQTPLSTPRLGNGNNDNALLGGVVKAGESLVGKGEEGLLADGEKLPFLPPLGFIKGTLLNGVDALVGGTPTPTLVRLHGVYKTAMNSTVNLDGCFILVEFQGEVSTERAIGKPSRMTCVYPDQGAVTYGVSGYVVDAKDGIIGVPGVFYEGDATRVAAAMMADFAAGVAEVIESNQSTFTTNTNGSSQKTLTGNQAKAEIAGGSAKAVSSLRDYLMERASRVVPFIRIDATRTINLVLLSGVEMRAEGSPWTLLFSADDGGL